MNGGIMKRLRTVFWSLLFFCFGMTFLFADIANATPKMLPAGTVVSAKLIKPIDAEKAVIVEITISGPVEVVAFENYTYGGIVNMGSGTKFDLNIREGRHFNFKFRDKDGKIYYALITPEMPSDIDFLGRGIALDCEYPQGCCFKVDQPPLSY